MKAKVSLHLAGREIRTGPRLTAAVLSAAIGILAPTTCRLGESLTVQAPSEGFNIRAESFRAGADIPRKFSCQGSDASPALLWTEPPAGTQSLALIADDPDAPAGTWVHWVLYDLPSSVRRLSEAISPSEEVAGGGRQGVNDFGKLGYGGPCPPPGKAHRYFFKIYALDKRLDLKAGATKSDLERAMNGHVLAKAEVMGRYHR